MKLAIFDIDGTIFRSSLVIELVRGLVRHRIFPQKAEAEVQKEHLAWLNRRGSYGSYIKKVVRIYIKYIAGKPSQKVFKVARGVIKAQKDRVYRYTRDLIKQLKKEKYFLVAISGSPSYIVESYARAAGFNRFFGTVMEVRPVRSKTPLASADAEAHRTSNGVKNGKFTGKVLSLDSAYNKKKLLMDFVSTLTRPDKSGHSLPEGEGKTSVDWKQSIAVGDTETDIEMLSLVGKPIAFNPNHQLAKEAKKKGWRIVVERKDVVWDIKDFRFMI